jgi:hypothetical protein
LDVLVLPAAVVDDVLAPVVELVAAAVVAEVDPAGVDETDDGTVAGVVTAG